MSEGIPGQRFSQRPCDGMIVGSLIVFLLSEILYILPRHQDNNRSRPRRSFRGRRYLYVDIAGGHRTMTIEKLSAASERNAFEEKSLKTEKHHNDRQNDQTGSRHQQVELNSVHRFEKLKSQRQGV